MSKSTPARYLLSSAKTSQRVSCLGVTSHVVVGRAEGQALRESEGLDYLPSR